MSTLKHKQISVTLRVGKGEFGEDGANTLVLSGPLRATAQISIVGGPSMCKLDMRIFGMSLSNMNAFSTLGPVRNAEKVRNNEILVEAGDTTDGMSVVYGGTVINAYADMSSQPHVSMVIQSFTGLISALRPINPSSYRGLVDVITIMESLANTAGMGFKSSGVTSQLIDPYLPGTVWDQLDACARAAGISWALDSPTNTIIVWPKNGAMQGAVPIVSPQSGLIGYPTFSVTGIEFDCIYNPSIAIGRTIMVESSLFGASGIKRVDGITHLLESETPGGQWFSHVIASPLGSTFVPPHR